MPAHDLAVHDPWGDENTVTPLSWHQPPAAGMPAHTLVMHDPWGKDPTSHLSAAPAGAGACGSNAGQHVPGMED